MPLNSVEILNLITDVCDEKGLQITVKESLKGGLMTGVSAGVTGFILGPLGLAIGK